MVPGWSERERQSHDAVRQEWLHANRRDGPAPGARMCLSRVSKARSSLAAHAVKAIWWGGRHMVRLAGLTTQICALRTFSFLEQVSRGGTQ
jgi:hypothetical protein